MNKPASVLVFCLCLFSSLVNAQGDTTAVKSDTLSKFDAFNKKMERYFKIFPVPIYSHSLEAGDVFGLAKFNLIKLDKRDTVSSPSRISEVATASTKGRINVSVATDLYWHQSKYMVKGYVNYRVQPEVILGIGNDVSVDDAEEIEVTRLKFVNYGFIQFKKNFYIGLGLDLTMYEEIDAEDTSFLHVENVSGVDGGTGLGIGIGFAYDSRTNKYNPMGGGFAGINTMNFPSAFGNPYLYSKVDIDLRKYFNPWHKHVIALQTTTSYRDNDVPFYELAMMGGDSKMRGYYEGAIRDKVLLDAQVEYRMPIWNIFGATAWIGTGRVAHKYSELALDGFWLSYGGGLRIKVDSENNTNMRFDFGFGPNGVNGFYINFAEAF